MLRNLIALAVRCADSHRRAEEITLELTAQRQSSIKGVIEYQPLEIEQHLMLDVVSALMDVLDYALDYGYCTPDQPHVPTFLDPILSEVYAYLGDPIITIGRQE